MSQWNTKSTRISLFLAICWLTVLIAAAGPSMEMDKESCPEDYAPCTCTFDSEGLRVSCSGVSVQDVVDIFNRTMAQDLYTFDISWTRTALESVTIPADFLGNSRAQLIGVSCPSKVSSLVPLRMDKDAFRSSRDYTIGFVTFYCDWSQQLDLQFLAGFTSLTILELGLATDIQAIGRLPTLPALTKLHVMDSTGLVEFPDLSPASLQTLFLNGNQMDDNLAARMLNSVISTSTTRLFTLRLNSNRLTKIPVEQIASFPEITNLYIDDNYFPVLTAGSFTLHFPVTTLSLSSCSISTIEPGTFTGDFTMATVNLSNNNLTRFESAVFLRMLEQMNLPLADGYVDIQSNPMKCDCGLAWLIRDNRFVLPAVRNGFCTNGIAFQDLDPASFADCP